MVLSVPLRRERLNLTSRKSLSSVVVSRSLIIGSKEPVKETRITELALRFSTNAITRRPVSTKETVPIRISKLSRSSMESSPRLVIPLEPQEITATEQSRKCSQSTKRS